jgi:hypothetical protein
LYVLALALNVSPRRYVLSLARATFIVATNIKTVSSADNTKPAIFTDAAYHLTLTIFDGKLADAMTFTGKFNGTLSKSSAIILGDFVGATTKSLVLGDHMYTVTIGPFAPPGSGRRRRVCITSRALESF